jgi:phosphoribosylcarboxyaminoimidazole (NCAIR) mutase
MASFRLNIARIRNCPSPEQVQQAMEEFGLPDTEEYGVISSSSTGPAAFGSIVRKTQQTVQKVEPDTKQVISAPVEKVQLMPFAIRPASETLEVYAGGAKAIEEVATFLASCLALPVIVDPIEVDVPAAIDKLLSNAQRVQLRSIRVSEYAHNSFMSGPYAPKFLDHQHGMEFLEKYTDFVQSANVRFKAPTGNASVTLTPKACFRFSCNEDDQPPVQSILRKLA